MDQVAPANSLKDETPPIPGLIEAERRKAAVLIQKTYRGHRARRQLNGFGLDASTRWYEAVRDARYRQLTEPKPPDDIGNAKSQWQRVTGIARRAGTDDRSPSVSEISSVEFSEGEGSLHDESTRKEREEVKRKQAEATKFRKKKAKMMDLQYFLEMVDHKHRYDSNLRKYHNYWKTQDTNQNFFYWLDQGDGRDVDLEECSRSRLDKEQVWYLSREERLNYLVKVNEQGLLVWAKNGELVWTKDELFKDSLKGIVPVSDPTPKFEHNVPPSPEDASDGSSSDGSSEDEADSNTVGDEGEKYVNEEFHRVHGPAKIKHVSAAVLFNHMVRSSLKKGHNWIFVAGSYNGRDELQEYLFADPSTLDASFRLYIGYKQSGAFQHSSFLHGARILAAGQIKVKRGQLRRLSPLSGHYRPPAANFRAFVQSLRDAGVDMSRVSISRSHAVLMGLEGYAKTRKKINIMEDRVMHGRDKLLNPGKVKAEEQAKQDKSESARKERIRFEEQREAEKGQQQGGQNDKSLGPRLFHTTLNKVKVQTNSAGAGTVKEQQEPRRMLGTGPEDGVPAPDGRR